MKLIDVDLDNVTDLERVWAELVRYRQVRDADPPLRAAILRRCGPLDAEVAAPILHDLDRMHPELVLEGWFTTLVPDMRTIGAVTRGSHQ